MSTSNSPQTLFRFVSLRNPNLAENSEKNLKFIFRPKGIVGFFDKLNSDISEPKLQALRNLAAIFSKDAIKSVAELDKGNFSELMKIGKSISLNKTLTPDELKSAKDFYTKLNSDSNGLNLLWDNLFYQYITQSNFYVKEAIVEILKAFHIGYVQSLTTTEELKNINGTNFVDVAINAIVVLPEFLFQESISTTSAIAKKAATVSTELSDRDSKLLQVNLEKQVSLSDSNQDRQNLQQVKSELQSIESTVERNNEKAYQSALQDYQDKNSEKLKLYQNQLEVIRDLEENNAPEDDIKKAYELLDTYEVPLFEFKNQKALSWESLYPNLTQESLALFLGNFTNAATVLEKEIDYTTAEISIVSVEDIDINGTLISITYNSFFDIYNNIDSQSQSSSQKLLSDSYLPQDEFANIGNVLIPVSSSLTTSFTHLSYILRATKRTSFWSGNTNSGYVALQIQLEDSSWNISHATLTAVTNLGPQSENFSNINVVGNTLTFPNFLVNKYRTISDLSLNIFFANGRETTLELTDIEVNTNITGILVLKSIKGQEEVPIDEGQVPVSGNHFGLKRLGVAEYMKVVQTVHAYVPGEVSNIENVMASELRHKSINELTRTEETVTTTKSQEVEKISDTNKVNRAEMQTEVAKEIEKQKSFQAHANFTYDAAAYKLDIGTAFATNNSQLISNRQAVTKSQEITERAMERVQSKITEERIMKIIQEVSLTNVHEFDNRGDGTNVPQHITGVYRWVDKKMKNQIFNYGKRTMFEFMIPEPAKLHRLAYANIDTLKEPVDPRKAPSPHTMKNVNSVTNTLLEYWAGVYGVNLIPILPNSKQIIHSPSGRPDTNDDFIETSSLQIPENYVAKNGTFSGSSGRNRGGGTQGSRYSSLYCSNLKGDMRGDSYRASVSFSFSETGLNATGDVEFKVSGHNVDNYNVKAIINCELSIDYINAWKLENFNAIIEAYKTAYEEYKNEKAAIEAERKAKADEQKDSQANFYRIIENNVLRHNCIAYLLQNYAINSVDGFTSGDQMMDFKVNLSANLDKFTAKAKFLEQALEWSIMDYTFYPYYWAARKMWQEMYLTENIDALFRSFLQAGLARVIVTVKPGFEEAMQYFLTTGEVWLGGETPIIGDPLYVSITQEMQEPTGTPQGNYWITRIPTTLTIIQAKSTGLEVDEPLPIFPEPHPENCENPAELETATVFVANDVQLSHSDKPTTLPNTVVSP